MDILQAIKQRSQKQTEFGYGIITADRYVKSFEDVVGLDECYMFASSKTTSYNDVLQKASETLVYSNPDMVVLEKSLDPQGAGTELPKNTLMAFKHVLTTPRKDRDGDILRTEGAAVDPKMLLLWQHMPTVPIGKMVAVTSQSPEGLHLVSAIVDINPMAHDAAVMIDNDMARFSHGFRALQYEPMEDEEKNFMGFDIQKFEIMEESVVSVPSNVDAEVSEVLVELGERGKFTSSVMKRYTQELRRNQPAMIAGADIGEKDATVEPEEAPVEDDTRDVEPAGCPDDPDCDGADETCPSVQEDECEPDCPEDCETHSEDEEVDKSTEVDDQKAGRSLSKATLSVIKNVIDDIAAIKESDGLNRGGIALCERCVDQLQSLVDGADQDEDEKDVEVIVAEPSVKEAMEVFLLKATSEEQDKLASILTAIRPKEATLHSQDILERLFS